VPRPSLERLVVSCRMPGATFDVMYSRPLTIVEPSNKLIVLGGTAGAITTLVLLAALYAPLPTVVAPGAAVPVSFCLDRSLGPRRRYLFAKHGTKAKAVLLSIVQREVAMAWSLLGEGFDLSGDAAVFVAIQADAQDPVLRANVSAIFVPAWVSFSLSVVVSVISLVVRASIFIVQLRRRRRDVSHIGVRISYLQRLEAKIEDGQRTIRMVRSPSPRI
jgi:hypothetical protein